MFLKVEDNTEDGSSSSSLTVKAYKNRLVRDHKELYKDPPVLPPLDCFETVSISTGEIVVPRREKKTGEFHFKDFPKFTPNLSPKEVLEKVILVCMSGKDSLYSHTCSPCIFAFYRVHLVVRTSVQSRCVFSPLV